VEEQVKNASWDHFVRIHEDLCNGCVLCMKVCPAKAIRVRGGHVARTEGLCIDCGECMRVCPRGAVKAITTGSRKIDRPTAVAIISPVLYTQFGEDITPGDIYEAVKGLGFMDVVEQAEVMAQYVKALELYIREKGKSRDAPRPLISPVCPVVVRLIAYRFPSLLKNVVPIITPRELSAREARKKIAEQRGVDPEEVRVYHVTPCAAKMISIKRPVLMERSYLDGAIGISTIYPEVLRELKARKEKKGEANARNRMVEWAASGGEIDNMEEGNLLAVSGMQETIRYLERIEMGLLESIDYVEFRACGEGCIGGPLTVADKYQAKYTIRKLGRRQRQGLQADVAQVEERYKSGWFFTHWEPRPIGQREQTLPLAEAIRRQEQVEKLRRALPGKECGACGSPDCATFAEDVVDERASISECVFLKRPREKGESG